jgi:RNA polymerase sigma factor (sigma-70 family)
MANDQANTLLRHIRALAGPQAVAALPDGQLLQEYVLRQSELAFSALLGRHGPMVWAVCRRLVATEADAEDAFQATFLVLARRAGSIRKQDSLGSFLYGTAYRVATRAQQSANRRRRHERKAASRLDDVPEEAWPELAALLDEELVRLPEKYRTPFVLCSLEGLSREEAAARLGWKVGTVCSRVAEARKRLQTRLARRGMDVPAVMLAGAVPATLVRSTLALTAAATRPALLGSFGAIVVATFLVAAVGIGLIAVAPPARPAPPTATAGLSRIDRLVGDLGSETFAKREAAARELARIGPPALDALRKAARHPDLEVRTRAEKLIPAIEHRAEVEALLRPTRIRLNYRDTPVTVAVADFSKTSGVPIQLVDNQDRLAEKTITLDTGVTNWWKAAETVSRTAGLIMSKDPLVLPFRMTIRGDPLHYHVGLRWTPGTSEVLAADSAGVFRVEARSGVSVNDGRPTPAGAHVLALSVWPEAKVHWQSVQTIRIDRASDDMGQALRLFGAVTPYDVEKVGQWWVVRLLPGEKPAKALKELSGRVTLRAATAPRVLVQMDDITKATGRTVTPSNGVALTLLEVREAAGKVSVRFRLRIPEDVIPAPGPARLSGSDLIEGHSGSDLSGLVVLDRKGQPCQLPASTEIRSVRGPTGKMVVDQYVFHYSPQRGRGRPHRLVYYGMRTLKVEVPFRLRNIPLR